jgi:hypothetical protein
LRLVHSPQAEPLSYNTRSQMGILGFLPVARRRMAYTPCYAGGGTESC